MTVGMGLNLDVRLDALIEGMGRLTGRLDRMAAAAERRDKLLQAYTPVDTNRAKVGTVDAGGDPLIISLGKPDQGTYWEVGVVTIGGADFDVAAAGSAGLYVHGTSTFPPGVTPGILNAVGYAASLPLSGDWGGPKIVVRANEHLLVCIFSGTAGQQYSVNATIRQFTTDAALGHDVTAS